MIVRLAALVAAALAAVAFTAAVPAGANQISGPDLLSSDRAGVYRNALRAAIADVAEAGATRSPMASRESLASDTQIEPGTQQIQATVNVTFGLG